MTRVSNFELRVSSFRREIRPMTRLAVPIVLANLGWMTMAIVDTIMVGRVSAEAIGAVSLGGVIFTAVGSSGGGVMFALDTLISQAFGAGDIEDCHHSLLSGLYLGLPLSAALMGFLWLFTPLLGGFGINPAVLNQAVPYLHVLTWSTPLLLAFFAFRSYLQAMNLARPVTFVLVSANLLNALGDWVLVYGHWGAPAMGAVGTAWSTTMSRFYMAAVLAAVILCHDRLRKNGLSSGVRDSGFGIRREDGTGDSGLGTRRPRFSIVGSRLLSCPRTPPPEHRFPALLRTPNPEPRFLPASCQT
ncbi:MAG TPA: MATE family efflux transporter [Terriglobia bacterium]|nr:MATE family efflux transporter [Terriglobia bacterium]